MRCWHRADLLKTHTLLHFFLQSSRTLCSFHFLEPALYPKTFPVMEMPQINITIQYSYYSVKMFPIG